METSIPTTDYKYSSSMVSQDNKDVLNDSVFV
jgi:hypothetical protein